LAEDLRALRCSVDLVDAAGTLKQLSPDGSDGVIVAASVHIGAFQRPVARWVRRHATALNRMPTAFLSWCLAVLEQRPEARQDVDRIVRRFFDHSGWRPTITRLVAGAVLYTRYPWLKKWMMKRIVAKAGGGTDTSRDYEYTDWKDLRAFARDFVTRLPADELVAEGVTCYAG
jgi:menaquinone-dependent protoporphyrinogen oxidase